MKILIVNPNTNRETTERIRRTSERVASAGTSIEVVTAAFGPKTIKTLEQSTNAADAALAALDGRYGPVDVAIIAAYSDPGLQRAKTAFAFPVVGIGEASMREAARNGKRFSIVTMGEEMVVYLRNRATIYGVGGSLASVRILPWTVVAGEPDDVEILTRECVEALRDDGADTIIIGGGPLAGFADQISRTICAPVLDGIECAVRLAERLVTEKSSQKDDD